MHGKTGEAVRPGTKKLSIMGVAQIIRTEESVTVITEQGHSATAEQWPGWSDSTNNDLLDRAIEEALSKDEK